MFRTSLIAGLLAVSCTAPVLAQTMAPSIDAPVTITFYNYNLATAGLGAEATQKLINEFMVANPNVTVEGIGYSSADSSRIQADLAAGRHGSGRVQRSRFLGKQFRRPGARGHSSGRRNHRSSGRPAS